MKCRTHFKYKWSLHFLQQNNSKWSIIWHIHSIWHIYHKDQVFSITWHNNPGHNILAVCCVLVQVWFATSERGLNISCKSFVSKLRHERPNNLKLSILGNYKTLGKFQNSFGKDSIVYSLLQIWTFTTGDKKFCKSKTVFSKLFAKYSVQDVLQNQVFVYSLSQCPTNFFITLGLF